MAKGGEAIDRGAETLAVAWFPIDELPSPLTPNLKRYLADALANHPQPIESTISYSMPYLLLRNFALSLRNLRNRIFRRF